MALLLLIFISFDRSKYVPLKSDLPPNYYPMIKGIIGEGNFQEQAWQYNGVIVTLDGREIPACYAADNKNNYVELLVFKETPQGITWTTNRAIGKVTISFKDSNSKREYIRWATAKGLFRNALDKNADRELFHKVHPR